MITTTFTPPPLGIEDQIDDDEGQIPKYNGVGGRARLETRGER